MTDSATSRQYATDWKEVFYGGSEEAEAKLFATFTNRIKLVQKQIKERERAPAIRRAFHAKLHTGLSSHIGVTNAEFRVSLDIPEDLCVGLFQPGATYQATVRFSNASGAIQPDTTKDLRGVALRITTDQGEIQDFLMTDAATSHARNARQFMVAAEAMASSSPVTRLLKLLLGLGPLETLRMVRVLNQQARTIDSLTTDQFWSRAPIQFGPYAVKFTLQPSRRASAGATAGEMDVGESYLKRDFIERLRQRPITYDFRVQRFVDEIKTPIEDGTIEWKESDSPFETIAQLVIPQQDLSTASAREMEALVDSLEFNPWHTTEDFRPLGNLNRARRTVYQASAEYRSGGPGPTSDPQGIGSIRTLVIALLVALIAGVGIFLFRRQEWFVKRDSQTAPSGLRTAAPSPPGCP